MLIRTKRILKKWIFRLSFIAAFVLLCAVNIRRLNNNIYSNYEMAVDYGRVREQKEIIEPVTAAVFYFGGKQRQKNIYTYLNHSDSYKKQNVKIIAVPNKINNEAVSLIESLYTEISKYNKVKKIFLAVADQKAGEEQQKLLRKYMSVDNILVNIFSESDFSLKTAEAYLQEDGALIVAAVDLNDKEKGTINDFMIEQIIKLAKKHFYKVYVFDLTDTLMVDASLKKYSAGVSKEEPLLVKQKRNLQQYVKQYENMLLKYYKQNFLRGDEKETIWPAKNAQTYRLYDRGAVYMRFFGENRKELFARAKIGKNKGIIVSVVELARKAARKISQPIKSFKIYLLTDFEPLDCSGDNFVNCLETDDGVYIQYKDKNALMVYDERPQNSADWLAFLYNRAGVPNDAKKTDIKLYRFKTVEIENEN